MSCKLISRLPFQIHEKPYIVPHIVVLLDMHLEINIESIELLAVDVANKASVFGVVLDFLVGGSQRREGVNNDTTDNSSDYQIDNENVSQVVTSRPRGRDA